MEDAGNDGLSDNSLASVVHNGGCQKVKSWHLKVLQSSQPSHIMIGLGPAWIVLLSGKVFEAVHHVDGETEEDVIVDEDLLSFVLIWVEGGQVAFDDCDCSFSSCLEEVLVNLLDGSFSLCSLGKVFLREVLYDLIFLVPISHVSWVKAIKRTNHVTKLVGIVDFGLLLVKVSPVMNLDVWLCQKVLLSV